MAKRSLWLLLALFGFVLVGWAVGAICRSALTATDLRLVEHVASRRTSAQIALAHAFSLIGSGYVVFPLTLICAAILYVTGRHSWSLAVAASTLGATAIANADKVLVGRPRPPLRHLEPVTGQSFPSGHTTHTAAVCMALVLGVAATQASRWLKITASIAGFLLVLCVAASRVFLGVHYPSDVVAGALLGTTWAIVACCSRRSNRGEPAPAAREPAPITQSV